MENEKTQGLGSDGLYTERPTSIATWTGRIDPLNPSPEEINIEDIAHALARQCRYNGHCDGFLSVARHSIWVSEHLEAQGLDIRTQLTGLLHDAAEAYLGDLVRPIKQSEFGQAYLKTEAVLEEMIAEVFGLPFPFPQSVRDADHHVLVTIELPDARYTYFGDYKADEADFLDHYYNLLSRSASNA
jgi:5'-deoxynucleotidase YfbR-like HD superfamily hydrolase